MSLFTPSQVVKRKTWFSAAVTGTPTAQLYVNNVAEGSAVNGTGSGAEWSFAITLPAGASASDSIQVIATATVDTWTERNELVEGSIATVTTKAEIAEAVAPVANEEMLDVLTTDTFAEPGAVPAATSSLKDKINWLFMLARNKITQTSTTQTVYADDGTTSVATSGVSDDGTTATRGKHS